MKTRQLFGLLLFVMVVILLSGAGLLYMIGRQIEEIEDRTIGPVQQINQDMATRVARFLEPTPTIIADPVSIIHEVRSLARLETIQYSVEKVIRADSGREEVKTLFGDKLLFVAHGEVIAGVDMAKLQVDDVVLEGDVVSIRLPDAEVLVTRLDNDKSYVYDRQTGLLVRPDTQLETLARQTAEDEIYQTAIEDGILKQARTNAENFIDRLIRSLGYDEVIFIES
ncbi:MAG: DUF4230 domain-containing protein [Leptolinea sp.]|nr:DUF4230 domain-containing protein [Leptolinea sp.]